MTLLVAAFLAALGTVGATRPNVSAVCEGPWAEKVPCATLSTGKKLPWVAIGSWSGSYKHCSSGHYGCVQDSARYAVENWMRIGGTHVDGANDYRSQVAVAEALKNSGRLREEVYITTKCPGAIGYQATIQCADDNLQMLGQFSDAGVGYMDMLLIHFPGIVKTECRFNRNLPQCQGFGMLEPATTEQLQDTWRAMEDLKRLGLVRSIGVSDYNITHLQQTMVTAREPIEMIQVEWNPKQHDEELLQFCKSHGILLQAWSPLGGSAGSVLSEPVLINAAKVHNVSTAQVALRWAIQKGVAVVVGTADPGHAEGDLNIFGFELTDGEMISISSLGRKTSQLVV